MACLPIQVESQGRHAAHNGLREPHRNAWVNGRSGPVRNNMLESVLSPDRVVARLFVAVRWL